MNKASSPQEEGLRSPETLGELIFAHCRPQPAIPAVLVFALGVLLPVMSVAPGAAAAGDQWIFWVFPVAIVTSCGLAVAAGFCSLFPTAAWIVLAVWAQRFIDSGQMPAWNRYLLLAGCGVAAAMLAVQIWRAVSGKFVPTIRLSDESREL